MVKPIAILNCVSDLCLSKVVRPFAEFIVKCRSTYLRFRRSPRLCRSQFTPEGWRRSPATSPQSESEITEMLLLRCEVASTKPSWCGKLGVFRNMTPIPNACVQQLKSDLRCILKCHQYRTPLSPRCSTAGGAEFLRRSGSGVAKARIGAEGNCCSLLLQSPASLSPSEMEGSLRAVRSR